MWCLSLAVILFGFIFFIHEGSLVQVSGFRVQELGLQVWGKGLGFEVQASGFLSSGLGFGVLGFV